MVQTLYAYRLGLRMCPLLWINGDWYIDIYSHWKGPLYLTRIGCKRPSQCLHLFCNWAELLLQLALPLGALGERAALNWIIDLCKLLCVERLRHESHCGCTLRRSIYRPRRVCSQSFRFLICLHETDISFNSGLSSSGLPVWRAVISSLPHLRPFTFIITGRASLGMSEGIPYTLPNILTLVKQNKSYCKYAHSIHHNYRLGCQVCRISAEILSTNMPLVYGQ